MAVPKTLRTSRKRKRKIAARPDDMLAVGGTCMSSSAKGRVWAVISQSREITTGSVLGREPAPPHAVYRDTGLRPGAASQQAAESEHPAGEQAAGSQQEVCR